MEKKFILRAVVLFLFKMKGVPKYCANLINDSFGPGSISVRTIERWYNKFREGDESLEDDERSGRPRNTNLEREILKALGKYPFFSVRALSDFIDEPRESIRRCLTGPLDMRKVSLRWVPITLTDAIRRK
ncbi:MAG: hypothetical protein EZS28_024136 [Streblomastix strix]|uniref:Mos1 transposase HTH domain-containing protein n=1 Tax=Streblomastix strix TaxID=222440 RepID=A0A5J4VCN9_9EUKA|nr:MAG: hypothetical protein EZS28_024136 [Streblomastix strix]